MTIQVKVDPCNPGQFFACCGLLELVARCWPEARGCFSLSGENFVIDVAKGLPAQADDLLRADLGTCAIRSTLTDRDLSRLKELSNLEKDHRTREDQEEKQRLTELWERERILFAQPFGIWIDWWGDTRAGGNRLKTWAGKQYVIDLVKGLQAAISGNPHASVTDGDWFGQTANDGGLPFYFDSDIGSHSASLDVGFSLDALKMRSATRPVIELLAFIGLQRFRPTPIGKDAFKYFQWAEPLSPLLAAVACCGFLPHMKARSFKFRILYRTKYLKGFLPAQPIGGR